MTDPELRAHADRKATTLFASTALIAAVVVTGMLVSGWHAGILDNRVEWVFWAGTILGASGVALFAAAAFPGHRSLGAVNRLIGTGLVLFVAAPVLCVIAVMTDYWI